MKPRWGDMFIAPSSAKELSSVRNGMLKTVYIPLLTELKLLVATSVYKHVAPNGANFCLLLTSNLTFI